jgi:hypothetical protein
MSKLKTKTQKSASKKDLESEVKNILPQKYETWICIGIIVISLMYFYSDAIFGGKTPIAPDSNLSTNMSSSFASDIEKGVFPLWSPYVFSGMPSYGSGMTSGYRSFDYIRTAIGYVEAHLYAGLLGDNWLIFYYLIFGVAIFLFMVNRGHSKLAATFSALAIVFSTTVAGWFLVGHSTKVVCYAYFPLVLLALDKIIEKMNWFYAALIVVVAHLSLEAAHVQIIAYEYMFIGIYLVYYFLRSLKDKEKMIGISRALAVLVVASGLAFALSADRYMSMMEYTPYSIRGSSPLVINPTVKSTTVEGGGLSYDYATNWSYSPGEVISFFVPNYYGAGAQTYKGPETNNQLIQIPYFGQMAFVEAPQYVGILVLILAFIGFYYYRKDVFVQSLMIVSFLALFISFGRNLPVLYDLFFYHLPFFNKFRTPVMMLTLTQISFVIAAGYGLTAIIDIYKNGATDKFKKKMLYATLIVAALVFISLAGKSVFEGIYNDVYTSALKSNTDNSFTQQLAKAEPNIQKVYFDVYFKNMMTDMTISLLIAASFFALTYLLVINKLKVKFYLPILIVICLIDLWRIDSRPMHLSTKTQKAEMLKKPDYVAFLEKDKTPYRVLELNENMPNSSGILESFKIQNIYGYNPAKLRIYQDVIENANIVNPFLWNLLNMKYLIADHPYQDSILRLVYSTPGKEPTYIMENKQCFERAFFVNRYEVKDKIAIVNSLRDASFNPKEVAYFESDPGIKVDPAGPEAKATVTGFDIHNLKMDVTATGNNLLFISEIYYPKGWTAYIDGKETPIYKTNYIFRSIVVPQGAHKVELKFEPKSFATGKNITIAINLLLICVFGFYGVTFYLKKRKVKK